MSPSSEKIVDANAAQPQPTTSHERAASKPAVVVPPQAHEMSADTDVLERSFTMLNGMNERMNKIKLSQVRLTDDERM